MRNFTTLMILFVLLTNFSWKNRSIANKKIKNGNQSMLAITPDKKLEYTWSLFARAILANDTISIKKLSTNCISCTECVSEDTTFINALKDNPELIEKLYNDLRYIPIDLFIKKYSPKIFNENIKSRLLDPSKILFIDNEHNKSYYENDCFMIGIKLSQAKLKEVLVTSVDPSTKYEGRQDAYAFIETEDGYKFCGFSTIP